MSHLAFKLVAAFHFGRIAMIIDLILATIAGISLKSLTAFFVLMMIAIVFSSSGSLWASGLFRFVWMLLLGGLFFSLFDDDCDFDA